jgi:hypothetical protein
MFQLIIQLIKLTNAQSYPTIIMTERKETSFKSNVRKYPIKVYLQSSGLEHNTDENLNTENFLFTLSIACY